MQKNSMNNVAGSPLQIASKMGFCQGNLDLKCQFGIFVNLWYLADFPKIYYGLKLNILWQSKQQYIQP